MTAVDAAVQARLLGAEESTIVYRRGPDAVSASSYEQDWAQTHGVKIRHWAAPKEVLAQGGAVTGVRFVSTTLRDGKLAETDDGFTLPADMVLRAIGQSFVAQPVGAALIGLSEGQSISWTARDGKHHQLTVTKVAN